MILELKGQGFKELVAKEERSLLKSYNTEEGTGADNSASKWEKRQGTQCPDGQMVHQKHLDGSIPEMTVPAKTVPYRAGNGAGVFLRVMYVGRGDLLPNLFV